MSNSQKSVGPGNIVTNSPDISNNNNNNNNQLQQNVLEHHIDHNQQQQQNPPHISVEQQQLMHQQMQQMQAGQDFQSDDQKDTLFPPSNAFYLVGFDQRADREKLYKAIKKYCWVVKFDLPRGGNSKKGCLNKGYAFVHTVNKDIVDQIVRQKQIVVLNRICAVDYFISKKHRDPDAVSVKPPSNNIYKKNGVVNPGRTNIGSTLGSSNTGHNDFNQQFKDLNLGNNVPLHIISNNNNNNHNIMNKITMQLSSPSPSTPSTLISSINTPNHVQQSNQPITLTSNRHSVNNLSDQMMQFQISDNKQNNSYRYNNHKNMNNNNNDQGHRHQNGHNNGRMHNGRYKNTHRETLVEAQIPHRMNNNGNNDMQHVAMIGGNVMVNEFNPLTNINNNNSHNGHNNGNGHNGNGHRNNNNNNNTQSNNNNNGNNSHHQRRYQHNNGNNGNNNNNNNNQNSRQFQTQHGQQIMYQTSYQPNQDQQQVYTQGVNQNYLPVSPTGNYTNMLSIPHYGQTNLKI